MAFGELSTGHRERGGSKEAIQGLPEKVAHYLQHYNTTLPLTVWPGATQSTKG